MRVFNETSTIVDPVRGKISHGGYAKWYWLLHCKLVFQCKPVQDFFKSFRSFHLDRQDHITSALDSEREKKLLLQFESRIKENLYDLLLHFDNVLNDPNVDWTGQDRGASPEAQEPQVDSPHVTMRRTDGEQPDPEHRIKITTTDRTDDKKRKREEPRARDEPQAKRAKQEVSKPIARIPRRRRPPPPPSDRVLRPRPWRI